MAHRSNGSPGVSNPWSRTLLLGVSSDLDQSRTGDFLHVNCAILFGLGQRVRAALASGPNCPVRGRRSIGHVVQGPPAPRLTRARLPWPAARPGQRLQTHQPQGRRFSCWRTATIIAHRLGPTWKMTWAAWVCRMLSFCLSTLIMAGSKVLTSATFRRPAGPGTHAVVRYRPGRR